MLTYYNGALSSVSTYVYDGEDIVLYNTFIAILVNEEYDFYTFKAKVNGGVMSIYDLTVFTASNPLLAVKKSDTFKYGTYFAASGDSYTFNADGTGTMKEQAFGESEFTYTVSGNTLTAYVGSNTTYTGIVTDGVVTSFKTIALTAADAFAGYWEKSAGSHKLYYFDGAGNWTYKYYGLNSQGKEVIIEEDSGSYTASGVLDNGTSVKLENGILVIGNEKYYVRNSFVGTWLYSGGNDAVEITFNGITTEGFGTAVIDYGMQYGKLTVNYEAVESNGKVSLVLYYYYSVYGRLEYDPALKTLKGSIYLVRSEDLVSNVTFCLYDDFKGTWYSSSSDFAKVTFNGRGNYDLNDGVQYGKVTIYANANDAKGVDVKYTLENGTLVGSFTYNEKTYNIEFDEENDVVFINGVAFRGTQEG